MRCAACNRPATTHIVWRTYDKWFCDSDAPQLYQLVNKFLTPKQLRFKKWLSKIME